MHSVSSRVLPYIPVRLNAQRQPRLQWWKSLLGLLLLQFWFTTPLLAENAATIAIGRGDCITALRLSQPLAQQGNAEAETAVAVCYLGGRGIQADYGQAAAWATRAADQGYRAGQYILGRLYQEGKGVPQDISQAIFWFRKAAAQGDMQANSRLAALGQGMPTPTRQAPPSNLAAQGYDRILDKIVSEDSQTWMVNQYIPGSMRNATIVSQSSDGTEIAVRGFYNYTYGKNNLEGWVEARFDGSRLNCIRYHDRPDDCRQVGQGNGKQLEGLAAAMARQQRLHPSRAASSGSNGNTDNCTLADHMYAPGVMGSFVGGMYLGSGCH